MARPRLLDLMARRVERRVTLITAGAGFGKSSLIAQAAHDPVTSDRVTTVFHRVDPADRDGTAMLASLAARLIGPDANPPRDVDVDGLTDLLWHRSPDHVSLIVDDIHGFPPGAAAWGRINDLIDALPENADIVLSGRGRHELTLARRIAQGEAVEITESMLAFERDELDDFARLRGVEPGALDDHGWPALTELEAEAGVAGAHDFVSEEVLSHLDEPRVAALRRVALHGVIDDELVAAVTDYAGTAAELLEGLPLTSQIGSSSWSLHELWRELLTASLPADERAETLGKISELLRSRGEIREALAAASRAGDDGEVLAAATQLARDIQLAHSIAERTAVVAAVPEHLADAAPVQLVRADVAFATEPTLAVGPLRTAIDTARDAADDEIESLGLLRLGDLAYRSGNRAGLVEIQSELEDLQRRGGRGADACLTLTDAWRLLLQNAASKSLALMDEPSVRDYPPIRSMVDYTRAVQLGCAGDCRASIAALEALRTTPDARILARLGGFVNLMRWYVGDLDDAGRVETVRLLDRIGADRQMQLYIEGAATASLFHASAGDLTEARRLVEEAATHRERVPESGWSAIAVELATAVVELLGGDEAACAARLEEAVPRAGPFDGVARHVFGNVGALVYTLVPRTRPDFDDEATGPDLSVATQVGRALVAVRERGVAAPAAALPWDDLDRLRTWAYEPHLAELAVAAVAAGNSRARNAFEQLSIDPRGALRSIVDRHEGAVAAIAADVLAETPDRPRATVRVEVLGPTAVVEGARDAAVRRTEETRAPIRRKMVRELLLLLVHRRRIRRDEAAAVLWPDKDENSARANLRATLNHLRPLLDGEGEDGAPPWHVRSDGETLSLFESDLLQIDADEFEREIDLARTADRNRNAAETVDHHLRAIRLYRGPYLADALDQDWAFNHRTKLHLDFVEASTRCAELCAAQGDTDLAIELARRAIDAEPLAERSHRSLVRALTASGDRAGARRALERAIDVVEADGLRPETATVRLADELAETV